MTRIVLPYLKNMKTLRLMALAALWLGNALAANVCHTDDSATWTGTVTAGGVNYTGKLLSDSTSWVCYSMTSHSTTPVGGVPGNGDYILVGPDPSGASVNSTKAHLLIEDVNNLTLGAQTTKPYGTSGNIAWSNVGGLTHAQSATVLPAGMLAANNDWVVFIGMTGTGTGLYETQAWQITNLGVGCSPAGNSCFDLLGSTAVLPGTLTNNGRCYALQGYMRIGSSSSGYGTLTVAPGITVTFSGQGPMADNGLTTNNSTYTAGKDFFTAGDLIGGGATILFDSPNGDATLGANTSSLMKNYRYNFYGTAFPVCGVANNGSGLVRLATCSTHNITTGQTVTVNAVDGLGTINGKRYTATIPDSTHVDLGGTTWLSVYRLRTSGVGTVGVHTTVMGKPTTGSANTTYPFFYYGTSYDGPIITAKGADFSYLGKTNGTGDWYQFGITASGADTTSSVVTFNDCLFDHMGSMAPGTLVAAVSILMRRSYWTNTLASSTIANSIFTSVVAPSQLTWDRVSFDKAPVITKGALTITNYYSNALPHAAGQQNGAGSSCTNCLVRVVKITSQNPVISPMTTISASYFAVDGSSISGDATSDFNLLTFGTLTVPLTTDGLVGELWTGPTKPISGGDSSGDFLVGTATAPNGVVWTFKHIIILPNVFVSSVVGQRGPPFNLYSGSMSATGGGTYVFEHNTIPSIVSNNGFANAEPTSGCAANSVTSLKSNIVYDFQGARSGSAIANYVPFTMNGESGSGACPQDFIPAAAADYNAGWNVTIWDMTGANTCHGSSLSCSWVNSGTGAATLGAANGTMYGTSMSGATPPGAHDLPSTSGGLPPNFVTASDGFMPDGTTALAYQRRAASWAVMNGWSSQTGLTQQAFNDAWTVLAADPAGLGPDLYNWVRAGYAPTNPAYQAAHDNVAPSNGWIGAVQGVTLCPSAYPAAIISGCNSIAGLLNPAQLEWPWLKR